MNIFFTNPDPSKCAEALDDKRLNKMILETAQLLSGAVRYRQGLIDDNGQPTDKHEPQVAQPKLSSAELDVLYKATHFNHPSAKFARASQNNYNWLYAHFVALAAQKLLRDKWRNPDKATAHLSFDKLNSIFRKFYDGSSTPSITSESIRPYLACDEDLKVTDSGSLVNNCFEAYQMHMKRKWIVDTAPKWTLTLPPKWAHSTTPHAIYHGPEEWLHEYNRWQA